MQTSVIKQYGRSLREHWIVYLLGTVSLLMTSVSEMIIPKFIQWSLEIVGAISDSNQGPWEIISAKESLKTYAWALLGSMAVGFIGRVGWRHLLARRTHEAGFQMKVDFWDALRFQPLGIFERYSLGDLMNRATGDWHAARMIHGFTLVLTLDLIFFTVFAFIMMFTISPYLAVLTIVVFPFLPKRILKLARREHDYHIEAQEKLSDLSQGITEILASLRFHRATACESSKVSKLKQQAEIYAQARIKVVKTGWKIYPLGALPMIVAYGILLTVGLWEVISGRLSIGAFVALQSYVLMLQGPLLELGDCIAEWQKGFASMQRIQEIIDLGRVAQKTHVAASDLTRWGSGSSEPQTGIMALKLEGVSFRYDDARHDALVSIGLEVGGGTLAGIMGPIGSGKSTLLKVCSRLIEPTEGRVILAERSLQSYSNEWIRNHVTLVSQKPFLFASTIRSNLNLNEEFSDDILWNILEAVCLSDDVYHFPMGLDSVLGESGTNLSGGQRQRLVLARALLRLKVLVLLDDALSAVDARTEYKILQNLERFFVGKTVLWVAHRQGTLSLCQRIYQMDRGRLNAALLG